MNFLGTSHNEMRKEELMKRDAHQITYNDDVLFVFALLFLNFFFFIAMKEVFYENFS